MIRKKIIKRKTKETEITVSLNIDGSGTYKIETGISFFDHMLTQIAIHGIFDLEIVVNGDLEIDSHHTIEDVAITLGKSFREALASKKGIFRTSNVYVPMDEALAFVALDLSDRPFCSIDVPWTGSYLGNLNNIIPVTMIEHFFISFAINAGITLHSKIIIGRDDHHMAESLFKALGKALDQASRYDSKRQGTIPSSKGVLRNFGSENND